MVCLALAGILLAGCGTTSDRGQRHVEADNSPAPFSLNAVTAEQPAGWTKMTIGRHKKPTLYSLRKDPTGTRAVLHARASQSASGMLHPVHVKVRKAHKLEWRWKVYSVIGTADNRLRHLEDAPARIVLAFHGDKSTLGFRDQIMFENARLLTGHEMPYATLMYIWSNDLPVGSVVHNPNTGRVRMLVVESGAQRVGEWREYARDVASDFKKAFGEDAGILTAIGVLTDTDNTGESVEAYYGDIRLVSDGH